MIDLNHSYRANHSYPLLNRLEGFPVQSAGENTDGKDGPIVLLNIMSLPN